MTLDDLEFPKRVWINAPSTLQPYNKFHGTPGLAVKCGKEVRFYFVAGDTICIIVDPLYLSEGWE